MSAVGGKPGKPPQVLKTPYTTLHDMFHFYRILHEYGSHTRLTSQLIEFELFFADRHFLF